MARPLSPFVVGQKVRVTDPSGRFPLGLVFTIDEVVYADPSNRQGWGPYYVAGVDPRDPEKKARVEEWQKFVEPA